MAYERDTIKPSHFHKKNGKTDEHLCFSIIYLIDFDFYHIFFYLCKINETKIGYSPE